LFAEAYIGKGGNAKQAAIEAGYSNKTAVQAGARLLTDVNLVSHIQKRRAEVITKAERQTGLSVEAILRELHDIVCSDIRDLLR
jgi:phage terminase small subunit